MASMRAAQTDVLSPPLAQLQPLMIAAAQAGGSVDDSGARPAHHLGRVMRGDAPEPLIFMAWLRETVRASTATTWDPPSSASSTRARRR